MTHITVPFMYFSCKILLWFFLRSFYWQGTNGTLGVTLRMMEVCIWVSTHLSNSCTEDVWASSASHGAAMAFRQWHFPCDILSVVKPKLTEHEPGHIVLSVTEPTGNTTYTQEHVNKHTHAQSSLMLIRPDRKHPVVTGWKHNASKVFCNLIKLFSFVGWSYRFIGRIRCSTSTEWFSLWQTAVSLTRFIKWWRCDG